MRAKKLNLFEKAEPAMETPRDTHYSETKLTRLGDMQAGAKHWHLSSVGPVYRTVGSAVRVKRLNFPEMAEPAM